MSFRLHAADAINGDASFFRKIFHAGLAGRNYTSDDKDFMSTKAQAFCRCNDVDSGAANVETRDHVDDFEAWCFHEARRRLR